MSEMSGHRGAGWSSLLAAMVAVAAGCSPSSDGARGALGGGRGLSPLPAAATAEAATAEPATAVAAAASSGAGAAAAATAVRLAGDHERARYPWLRPDARVRALEASIAPPPGYARVALEGNDFGAWLRALPLRAPGSPVRSYRGAELLAPGDARLAAVAELDVGRADLQQCADSIIRLHAEWLWSRGRHADIRYHVTSGDLAVWSRYAGGERPRIEPQKMRWEPGARADASRGAFARYLDIVFGYAGTGSLAQRAVKRARADVAPGDFFVLPGSPGHAVLVLDLARDASGRQVALLGQGYMPAQDFHVLAGPERGWYSLDAEAVDTPFWPVPFPWSALRRLPD
jgi:hypothetical protein